MKYMLLSKNGLILSVLLLIFSINSKAQSIENVIAAGKEDASSYLESYMQPAFEGLIHNLNSGWYHTGKVHKKYGFDLSINASASFVPDEFKTFNFSNANYTTLALDGSSTSMDLPTVMGQTSAQQINVRIPIDALGNSVSLGNHVGFKIYDFETLDGIEEDLKDLTGYVAVPSPMVQIGFGLPSKTDLKIRFVPKVGTDEVKFNLFGVGLQHSLSQYFKKEESDDDESKFDLSLLAAYTSAKTSYNPADGTLGVNQEVIIKLDAYTAQLIANYNLKKIIDFYGAFGYTAGTSSLNVNGTYTYNYTVVGVPLPNATEIIKDPIAINYSVSGMKATVGFRFNIKFFKIFADYSFQEYNTATAGIAFSFK